jgi:hypothetical protein
MKGFSVALLVCTISLVGYADPAELLFKNSIVVNHLDGNYQRLASCTYEHLARQQAQLSMTDLRVQQTVRQEPLKHTGSSRSSMKMAADRRGWKSRQALSQTSTPSHWLTRARHK